MIYYFFFSNKKIGKVKIFQDKITGLNYTVEQIKVEDVKKIKIIYNLKAYGKTTFTFLTEGEKFFQFKEVKYPNSLRKKIVKNFNIQTIEKVSVDAEVLVISEKN